MTFDRIEIAMTRLAAGTALLGGMGLIFATLVTCISILLKMARRIADSVMGTGAAAETLPWLRSILGEEELVTLGVGFALFAALPWAMIRKGHIKVDLFRPVFGDRLNRVLDLLGDAILAWIAYMILTRQWFQIVRKARGEQEGFGELLLAGDFAGALDRIRTSQESQILGIPNWPAFMVAEFLTLIFLIVALFCVWRSARALVERS